MTENMESPNPKPSRARRLTALSTVAATSLAVVVGGVIALHELNIPEGASPAHAAQSAARPGSVADVVPAQAAQRAARTGGVADVVARVKPAVISVRVIEDAQQTAISDEDGRPIPGSPGGGKTMGQGSGFFISADGYAVTNNHVVDHVESVEVTTSDGKSHGAKVVGTDPKTDLALIKVDGQDFPYVTFSDQQPRVGDSVIAIGNPYGLGGTVTAGIVSAEGRDIGQGPYDDFIQIDASINRGNSGGPAFDVNGNVIGVNTAIYSPSEGSVGIGFDIPAATAKAVIAELKDKGQVTRGWLGVEDQQVTADIAASLDLEQARGALVDEAQPSGPAAAAGVKSRDVITAVNGVAINDPRELAQKVGGMAPGTSVTLSVIRDGEAKDLTLKLGTMPNERRAQADAGSSSSPASSKNEQNFGLMLAPAKQVPGAGKKGVVVVAIDSDGAAEDHGLQAGDIILDIAGKEVSTPNEVRQEFASLRKSGKQAALMRVRSGDATQFVGLPLGQE
jgi:serine protease Do